MKIMQNKRAILIISAVLLQTMLVALFVNVQILSDYSMWPKYTLPIWTIVAGFLGILCVISIRQMEEMNKEYIKDQLLKSHYQEIETLLTASRIERHEYRKHLQALQACLHLELLDDARQYLDRISEQPAQEEYLAIENPVLFGLINSKYALARARGIQFSANVNCNLTSVKIEPWDLNSILGNLLDNAMEAAALDPQGPRVSCEISDSEGEIVIVVQNNGPLISEPDKERVWEVGFSTKGGESRGYGLYIVKNLVDGYRGVINIVSDSETKITVRLPGDENDRPSFKKNSGLASQTALN
jgi:sensor histidine kinase regulating citrate/malate metabolism